MIPHVISLRTLALLEQVSAVHITSLDRCWNGDQVTAQW